MFTLNVTIQDAKLGMFYWPVWKTCTDVFYINRLWQTTGSEWVGPLAQWGHPAGAVGPPHECVIFELSALNFTQHSDCLLKCLISSALTKTTDKKKNRKTEAGGDSTHRSRSLPMLDSIDCCGDDDFFFASFARAIAAALASAHNKCSSDRCIHFTSQTHTVILRHWCRTLLHMRTQHW